MKESGVTATALAESLDYLDWPGRPPVKRKVQLRPLSAAEIKVFEQGRALYETCAVCHQMDGGGSPGLAPSLVGSSVAQGPEGQLIRVLLHGLEGKYTMSEMEFDGAMVPAPFEKDQELAAVMTFIRRSWGNAADPVSPEAVARVRGATRDRAKAWTRDELKGIPDADK
jgi:mono/diheme cytochrome c family protein